MYIKSIELINFRNYIDQTIDLNKVRRKLAHGQ